MNQYQESYSLANEEVIILKKKGSMEQTCMADRCKGEILGNFDHNFTLFSKVEGVVAQWCNPIFLRS